MGSTFLQNSPKKPLFRFWGSKEFPKKKKDPNFAPSVFCKAPPNKAKECVWIDLKTSWGPRSCRFSSHVLFPGKLT